MNDRDRVLEALRKYEKEKRKVKQEFEEWSRKFRIFEITGIVVICVMLVGATIWAFI